LLFSRFLLDNEIHINSDNLPYNDKDRFLDLIQNKENLYNYFNSLKKELN
jgi:hypothetical protein